MFPKLEDKIEDCRKKRDPKVIILLGLLSKAEQAFWSKDRDKAQYIVDRALKL